MFLFSILMKVFSRNRYYVYFLRHVVVPSIGKHPCLFVLVERGLALFLSTHSLQHGESELHFSVDLQNML